jgi:hypothetical protein
MLGFFVGFLIGLLAHRGYLKIVGWFRVRTFERGSYELASKIAEEQYRSLHEHSNRSIRRSNYVNNYSKIRNKVHGETNE